MSTVLANQGNVGSMLGPRSIMLALCLLGQACTCSDGDAAPAKRVKRPPPKATPMVMKELWTPVEAAVDPLASHRPVDVNCPRGGWVVERQGFEIRTRYCNYAMFSQPSLAPVEPGDRIVAMLYHFDLADAEPATAHLALMIGPRVVWEKTIEIPGKANAYNVEVISDFSAPAGTPVYLHLHNHGRNEWTLASVGVVAAANLPAAP